MKWTRLTEDEAQQIADAYFIYDKDRMKMGHALGLGRILDMQFLSAPMVRRKIIGSVLEMRRQGVYSRQEHIEKLKEIRDRCLELESPKFKEALAAEIAVGRAAGLYENIGGGEEADMITHEPAPENLTTAELRARLNRVRALPSAAETVVVQTPARPADRDLPVGNLSDDEAF